MQKLKGNTLLAYTAGIIDGEGSIGLHRKFQRTSPTSQKKSIQMVVAVGNTNEWLINLLYMQFGGSLRLRKPRADMPNQKKLWEWSITNNKASNFLALILPYLTIKRPQAELAIQFQNRRKGRGHALSDEQRAIDEANRILMSSYNQSGERYQRNQVKSGL